MVKEIIFVMMVFISIFTTSCDSPNSHTISSTDNGFVVPEIDFQDSWGLDIELEELYDNIYAYTEYEEYGLDVEQVACTIQNNNRGKGFYVLNTVFLEKLEEDNWVNVDYQPPELSYESVWSLCAVEGNVSEPNVAKRMLTLKYVNGDIDVGKYRLVVHTGETVVYAPFEFVENHS